MKTDISNSTARFRALLERDLTTLLAEHRDLVFGVTAQHGGHILKSEGDGFWFMFPSVTAAALAAVVMQEELRLAQAGKGDDRLAMRIVISLGDVLHQDGGLAGDAVVLAARIEGVTPSDAIYLSQAAWLAISRAEVRTSLVDMFALKGFDEPVAVYQIDQTHRTRVIEDQYIVVTDLRGFFAFTESHSMTAIEKALDHLLDVVGRICKEFGGINRFAAGDSYFLTFAEPDVALAAVERLYEAWSHFEERGGLHCPINIAVHKGVLYAFRAYLYGRDVNVVMAVESATHAVSERCGVFVTNRVRDDLAKTPWAARLQPIDLASKPAALTGIVIYRLV